MTNCERYVWNFLKNFSIIFVMYRGTLSSARFHNISWLLLVANHRYISYCTSIHVVCEMIASLTTFRFYKFEGFQNEVCYIIIYLFTFLTYICFMWLMLEGCRIWVRIGTNESGYLDVLRRHYPGRLLY